MIRFTHRAVIHHGALRAPLRQSAIRVLRFWVTELPWKTGIQHQHTRSQFLKDFLAQLPTPSNPRKSIKRMASDDDYSNFLDKANQDTGASKASTQSTSKPLTKSVDTDVPGPLQKIELYYTSEADEPFEPVSLRWNGKNMPSESLSFHVLLSIYNFYVYTNRECRICCGVMAS